jgi:hypothetical protein
VTRNIQLILQNTLKLTKNDTIKHNSPHPPVRISWYLRGMQALMCVWFAFLTTPSVVSSESELLNKHPDWAKHCNSIGHGPDLEGGDVASGHLC